MFNSGEYIEVINENIKILKQCFDGMLMISGREFVMLSALIERNGTWYIIAKQLPEYEK